MVLRSDQLDAAQSGFQLLKTLAWLLPLLTLVAFAVAVWLAGERRRAVRGIGIVLVVVGALGLIAARLTRNYLVDALVAQRDDRQAADNAWNILTDLMRGSFRIMVVVGILFLVAAWLSGPARRAIAARSWLTPALHNRVWAYVALAIVALFLIYNGEVQDFTRFLFVAVIVALGAIWIEVTRAQTQREFPDGGDSALVADTKARVSEWWDQRRAASSAQPTAGVGAATDTTARLASLADLHENGHLTDEEYASAKARVLAGD